MKSPPLLNAPPVRFAAPVRKDLDARKEGLADETERVLAAHVRPCVAVTAKRVSAHPLRRNRLTRLLGARTAAPLLPATASKFGGIPYCEGEEDWKRHRFLGQIDLDEATSVLPSATDRLHGLLRFDYARAPSDEMFRVRWFPQPETKRAVASRADSVGNWEARLAFALAWTLPEGNALDALWPLRDGPRWYDYDRFYPPGFNADGFDEFHRLLGHKSSGLDEHYGFTPPPGCKEDIASYEALLRLTFDNQAGFSWGTNWVYLIVPREDLARGDLRRVVVTGANS